MLMIFLPELMKGSSFSKLIICGALFINIISNEREILMHRVDSAADSNFQNSSAVALGCFVDAFLLLPPPLQLLPVQ